VLARMVKARSAGERPPLPTSICHFPRRILGARAFREDDERGVSRSGPRGPPCTLGSPSPVRSFIWIDRVSGGTVRESKHALSRRGGGACLSFRAIACTEVRPRSAQDRPRFVRRVRTPRSLADFRPSGVLRSRRACPRSNGRRGSSS
jgi:hypothetical protein